MPDDLSTARLTKTLARQHGVLTLAQAVSLGISSSAVSRRVASGRWVRILPRVYATFDLELTEDQRVWAAVLYAGEGAAITGWAALRRHQVRRLPEGPTGTAVQLVTPATRQSASRDFVVVQRSKRPARPYLLGGLPTMPVSRATVDASAFVTSYEAAFDLLVAVVHSGRATLQTIRDELELAPSAGTRHLRAALREGDRGSRSVAEAEARALFAAAGFPTPVVNESIEVNGQVFVPDLRWGLVIVEIDSKEWHLLHPGSFEATQLRRAVLEAAGYRVIPVSPSLMRTAPDLMLAMVKAALVQFLEWPA